MKPSTTIQDSAIWRKALVEVGTPIQNVIRNLDETGLQIALVIDSAGVLHGTVTDGDVRRALLKGVALHLPVDTIMFQKPMVCPPEMGRDMVLHLMRVNKIHQLPVIDAHQRVVGLHVWDEVMAPASRPNALVVMAGGFGKRLRPYTDDCPKPMLKVGGKPMLEHIIERAADEGFSNFYISVHYLAHVIEDYFGDGAKWNVNIRYIHEDAPLGTAGALSLISPAPDLPFVVTNGDVFTDVRFGEMLDFHLHHQASATMAVRQHEWQHPFGVVKTDGIKIVGFDEKPVHRTHVNAGIYVLQPQALMVLEPGKACDMPTLFEKLGHVGQLTVAYPMHEPWLDVGRVEDLNKANQLPGSV